jgi:hypothetical protein
MKKTLAALILSVTATLAQSVHFDTDKAQIKDTELPSLSSLSVSSKAKVIIIGNADKRGSYEYNFLLASRRVLAVKEALIKLGVDASQIILEVSNGEMVPVSPSLDPNRRVDIVIIEPEVITKTITQTYTNTVEVDRLIIRRHRLSLLGGFAPSGLNRADLPLSIYKISQDYDWEAGLGYQFLTPLANNRLSLGIMGFTNKSGFLSLGLDF